MMLGQKIKELRENAGLKQRELAYQLGVGEGFLSKVESDQKSLKRKDLTKLNELFKTPIEELESLWLANKVYVPYKEIEEEIQTVEEQLELFFSKDFEKTAKNPNQDENLGQVFTSVILAKFMIDLLKESLKHNSRILDPCIGPNTFFKAMSGDFLNCNLTGIEIDLNLINKEIKKFFENPERILIEGSFFDLPIIDKFDLIIQNPPYVRQELLIDGANSKASIRYNASSLLSAIPSQSNLYIYFLLKSILHLKDNGVMVIVPMT